MHRDETRSSCRISTRWPRGRTSVYRTSTVTGCCCRGSGCETLIEELLASAGSNPEIICFVRDNATLASMVGAGLGLTIMPELASPDERWGLTVVHIQPILRRGLHVLTPQSALLGPIALAFLAGVGNGVDEIKEG